MLQYPTFCMVGLDGVVRIFSLRFEISSLLYMTPSPLSLVTVKWILLTFVYDEDLGLSLP